MKFMIEAFASILYCVKLMPAPYIALALNSDVLSSELMRRNIRFINKSEVKMKRVCNFAASKLLLAVLGTALMLVPSGAVSGALITQWTFEVATPADLSNSTAIGPIAADVGTGAASGLHASALTNWTTPAGNGSVNSLSSNNWAIGDYYQFSTSTAGFEDITISWAQTSSSTGPGEFTLAYQVNGGGFNDFLNYTVLPNQVPAPGLGSWNSTTEISGYNFSVDLTAVSALDNVAGVDFRLVMRTTADATPPGTVAGGGTSRVDNFTVNGISAVPEPSSLGLVCFAGLSMCLGRMRRKPAN